MTALIHHATEYGMEIRKTLRPGAKGTRRWIRRYGDRLIAVRYRYDPQRDRRYTTVELVVDEFPWQAGTRFPKGADPDGLRPEVVMVRIRYQEHALRDHVKRAGGRWDPTHKAWEMRFEEVVRLGLEARIHFLTQPPVDTCEVPTDGKGA